MGLVALLALGLPSLAATDLPLLLARALGQDGYYPDDLAQQLDAACAGGEPLACGRDGWWPEGVPDRDAARAFFEPPCAAGRHEACLVTGWIDTQETWGELPADPLPATRDAVERFRVACEAGVQRGCAEYAYFLIEGIGVVRNVERGAELARAACDAGVGNACRTAAIPRRSEGREWAYDLEVLALYRKGCEAGDAGACRDASVLVTNAVEAGQRPAGDHDLALDLALRACGMGAPLACLQVEKTFEDEPERGDAAAAGARFVEVGLRGCGYGNLLVCQLTARGFAEGGGVERDLARARDLMDATCTAGRAEACNELGWILGSWADGGYGAMDVAIAHARACRLGDMAGCVEAGEIATGLVGGTPEVRRQGQVWFEQACEGGNATGCFRLAWTLVTGDGLPEDRPRAARMFEVGCEGGLDGACVGRGLVAADAGNAAEAAHWLHQGCDANVKNAYSCYHLGRVFLAGRGIQQSDLLAGGLFVESCARGHSTACVMAGLLTEAGRFDVAVQPSDTFSAACTSGDLLGCLALAVQSPTDQPPPLSPRIQEVLGPACEADLPAACALRGLQALNGWDRPADPAAGEALLDRACRAAPQPFDLSGAREISAALACRAVAGLNADGRAADPSRRAARLYRKLACARGDPVACR